MAMVTDKGDPVRAGRPFPQALPVRDAVLARLLLVLPDVPRVEVAVDGLYAAASFLRGVFKIRKRNKGAAAARTVCTRDAQIFAHLS